MDPHQSTPTPAARGKKRPPPEPQSMAPPPRPPKRPAHESPPKVQSNLAPWELPSDQNDADYSSDWEDYGGVPEAREEYDRAVTMLDGSENWNAEQSKVHKLVYMRGIHPMIPSTWRLSYKMWGVTQPHLDDVFTPPLSRKRVVISANRNEVDAAKALESLFYLSQMVTDYEDMGEQEKIGPTVVKAISAYIKWALRDVEVDKRLPSTMMVHGYPTDFIDSTGAVADSTGAVADSTGAVADSTGAVADNVVVAQSSDVPWRVKAEHFSSGDEEEDDEEVSKELTRQFRLAVEQDLEKRMRAMGRAWRQLLRHTNAGEAAPTLYGFAVTQHMVIVVSLDANRIKNPVVVLGQITLNDRGLWLWNAMSIAIPVNIAKKAVHLLFKRLERKKLIPHPKADKEEDPDK